MLFNSYPFIFLFAPIAIAIFGLFSEEKKKKVWLLLSSLFFYGIWNLNFLVILIFSMSINYVFSRFISKRAEQGEQTSMLLPVAIFLNFFLLFYYKILISWPIHWNGQVLNLLPTPISLGIPLGISFYTFTQTAFLIDCNSGKVKSKNFLDYALFITFFPHLIAGPILHHSEIIPQFSKNNRFRLSVENLSVGLSLFFFGLAKKAIIADTLAQVANRGFDHANSINSSEAWIAAFFYAFQLYFDFSGYSDMANGLAKCFGIDFPLNFNSPFKAKSLIDFWKRWHMTLTRYLTDLVFGPISIQIKRRELKQGRSILFNSAKTFENVLSFLKLVGLPLTITMVITGIWHSVSFNCLLFGLINGFALCVNHYWRTFVVRRKPSPLFLSLWYKRACHVLTFFFVVVVFVIFRAKTFLDAAHILRLMIKPRDLVHNIIFEFNPFLNITIAEYVYFFLGTAIIFLLPNLYEITQPYYQILGGEALNKESKLRWKPNLLWAFISAVLVCISLIMISAQGAKEFLYFQF